MGADGCSIISRVRHLATEMTGPDAQIDRRIVDGLEERQADDVVIVTVGEEQIDVADLIVEHAKPSFAGAGARVESCDVRHSRSRCKRCCHHNDQTQVRRPDSGDTAANAPELRPKEIFTHIAFSKWSSPTALT